MGVVGRWFQNASPLSKALMAISVTTSLVLCHRLFYAPYVRRKRFRQAEEWANTIFEQEENMQGQPENNYGSYQSY